MIRRPSGSTRLVLGLVLALLASRGVASACSQCLCGSPTPPGYLLDDSYGRFGYGIEERYLSKENALLDAPGTEQQTEHRISALIRYRPLRALSLQARLPYVAKQLEESVDGAPTAVSHENGLGDLELGARFDALSFGEFPDRPAVVAIVAGLAAPTGSNERTNESGERLEAHLQPGSGAWSGTAGVVTDGVRGAGALSASVMGRVNGTSAHGYHYGNAVLFNAGCARTLSASWEAALELNGRSAARDRTEDGTDDPNSGGTLLYVAPSLRWRLSAIASVAALVQVPVVQNLYGEQSEHTSARVGVTFGGR
jgi:hypothetical protein